MSDLSIIVPIYNTPTDALQRCFDSVLSLCDDISWEVLLVDDGSGPEVGVFCTSYTQDHPQFRYIRQENGGVSSARNTGLANATGTFITFLDADDTLISQAITAAQLQSDIDLFLFDILLLDNHRESIWAAFDQPSGSLSPQQLIHRLIVSKSLNGPYAKLYRRSVIAEHSLRFDPAFITGEDWMFVCDYATRIQSIRYEATASYRYYRDGATSYGRLARQPDVMIANYMGMFQRKLALIPAASSISPAADLESAASADLVETLFNTAADLLLLKLLTPARKRSIKDAIVQASQSFQGQTSRKTRIKAKVIHHHFYLLRPLALLRNLYLKYKH